MPVEKEIAERIQKIIGKMKCPKEFACVESGFALLCKAKDIGDKNFLDCLDPEPKKCVFAVSFESTFYCQCPLRKYIKKNLHK